MTYQTIHNINVRIFQYHLKTSGFFFLLPSFLCLELIVYCQSHTKNEKKKGEEREKEVEKHFLLENNFLIFDSIYGTSEAISKGVGGMLFPGEI